METPSTFISKQRIWTGYIPRALSVLFFVMDGGMKLFKPPFVVQATVQLGYPESAIVGIGVALFFLHGLVRSAAHRSPWCDFA